MARKIPPPPTNNPDFDYNWVNWLNLLWRRTKNLEGGNSSEKGDETAIHTNFAGEIQTITQKATPVDADEFVIEDSAASYAKKALTWANLKATLLTGFNLVYLKLDASNDPITAPLEIQGAITATGVIENVVTKTANYTLLATDDNVSCDTSGGAFTITLPASPETGRIYTIILEAGSNPLTIAGNGKNIMGDSSKDIIYTGTAIQLVYDGTQWSAK